ncbi:MAG: hypothetical protein IJ233_10515 [Pyramidobacter sp.]|nr:hypothetical protein [Pyramidobacter sp.]
MTAGAFIVLLIIIGAVVTLVVTLSRDTKPKKAVPPPTARGVIKGIPTTPPVPPPQKTLPAHKPPRPSTPSVFQYRTANPFWLCPNCACENKPGRTHCCVCFWDRSVEVR